MPRKKRDVKSILLKKGFEQINKSSDHDEFWLVVDGKKTSITTKISFSGDNEISDSLLALMKREMNFDSKRNFNRYFDCDMKRDEYIAYLKERHVIS
ncbi:MAG: hypothetical protein PHD03_04835 [Bacilli bacterium]|nr:hypothetical protein [Bacilli bacterium]